MQLILEPEAIAEAQDLYQWYEEKDPGVGEYFFSDLSRCLEEILDAPERPRRLHRGLRKWKLQNFPILVFYRATSDSVRVTSVFHGYRHPWRWQRRA